MRRVARPCENDAEVPTPSVQSTLSASDDFFQQSAIDCVGPHHTMKSMHVSFLALGMRGWVDERRVQVLMDVL